MDAQPRHAWNETRRRRTPRSGSSRPRLVTPLALVALAVVVTAAFSAYDAPSSDLTSNAEQRLFEAHQQERSRQWSEDLAAMARAWSARMADSGALGHSGWLDEQLCCFSRVAENVGYARVSGLSGSDAARYNADRIMQGWMDSSGHRENIRSDRYTAVGIGVAVADDGSLWATAVFGGGAKTTSSSSGAPTTASTHEAAPAAEAVEVAIPEVQSIDALCGSEEVETSSWFDDVDGSATRPIDCLATLGIATGTAPQRFSPDGVVTRSQMAAFVARALDQAGADLPDGADEHFDDVDPDATSATAIGELAAAGVVDGRSDDIFAPDDPVTRGQTMAFLMAADEYLTGDDRPEPSEAWFSDVAQDATLGEVIGQAADLGIATGDGDGRFAPDDPVHRSQVARFIARWLAASSD